MTVKHGNQRPSKVRQGCKRSELKGEPRSLGAFSSIGRELRAYSLSTVREDSDAPNTVVTGEWAISGISGKLVSQLISETEKQLAYYEQQSETLRERLKELRQIPESLKDINHKE